MDGPTKATGSFTSGLRFHGTDKLSSYALSIPLQIGRGTLPKASLNLRSKRESARMTRNGDLWSSPFTTWAIPNQTARAHPCLVSLATSFISHRPTYLLGRHLETDGPTGSLTSKLWFHCTNRFDDYTSCILSQ